MWSNSQKDKKKHNFDMKRNAERFSQDFHDAFPSRHFHLRREPRSKMRTSFCNAPSSFKRFMGWPNRLRLRPTPPDSYLLCLRRRQCRYRSGSGSPHRSPWAGPSAPSSRPPRISSCRRSSSSRGRAHGEAVGPAGRWRGNVGWWCGGIQNRESSECREGKGGRRRQGSGWARHPTRKVCC